MRSRRRRATGGALLLSLVLLAACGSGEGATSRQSGGSDDGSLLVSPQNSTILVGYNRLGFALLLKHQPQDAPVLGARSTLVVQRRGGQPLERQPLEFIGGGVYKGIPVYLGVASFPSTGEFELVVTAQLGDGSTRSGHAFVNVSNHSQELPVGHSVTEVRNLRQRVARDVGGNLGLLDSTIKDGRHAPDAFHDQTIADGLAAHRPMVLYFGQPGHCVSEVCGPTIDVLGQLAAQYQGKLLVEHIEVHDPADGTAFNPVYAAFGFTSEPWIYFVNAQGIVTDRYEGPVSLDQLVKSAQGTLAGKVPAVDVAATAAASAVP